MVQEKDAAIKRVQSRKDFLKKTQEELEARTIKFAWVVIEHTPGYNTGGYYDTDIPPKNRAVTGDFDTKEEALEWLDRHEPDEGNSLLIKRKRLVKREWTEWVWY